MTNTVDMEFVKSGLKVYTFSDKILDKDVFFHVIKLTDSFHLWIGASGVCGDLSLAMMGMQGRPTSSTVLVGGSTSHTQAIAERLSKKTKKQVFVGGDLNSFSQLELPLIEKRIAEEMKNSPDVF